jgi:hypothetical protein
MHEDEKELLDAAPAGTEIVTTVTSSEAGPPAVIINQFTEDENSAWKQRDGPIQIPMTQLPAFLEMLEAALAQFNIVASAETSHEDLG